MKHFFSLLALLTMLSCASTKQYTSFSHEKELQPGMGRIYLIKPSFVGSAVKVSIFCDDKLIGNVANGSYLAWDTPVGEHTIGNTQFAHAGATLGAARGEDLIRVNVKDGQTYYIRITPKVGRMEFTILDKVDGERQIKGRKKPKLNYID
jgi:hypothetical protein